MGACNYSADAVFDDDSCDFDTCRGCTYSAADNYDPTASVDDGSCLGFDPPLVCPGDNNSDGFIGIDDIMYILTHYGTNCALE